MVTTDVRWTCSAQIDLLGFSSHLEVAKCDVRNQIGTQAIKRLQSLEDALRLFQKEKTAYPQLYPEGLQHRRFNDTLFLGVDAPHLTVPMGRTTLTGGYTFDQLKKLNTGTGQTVIEGTTADSGADVAKFLGLVARIHESVSKLERARDFPGCRTVVASGLRTCFSCPEDDFFSANLSVSMAHEADRQGSAVGLEGSHFYVEDDVGVAVTYCEPCHAILAFAKFLPGEDPLVDPYQYSKPPTGMNMVSMPWSSWSVQDPVSVRIMRKDLVFRRLNPVVLTNLQLFKDYQRFAEGDGELESEIRKSLTASTPSLEDINKIEGLTRGSDKYPFLSLLFELEAEYRSFLGQGSQGADP